MKRIIQNAWPLLIGQWASMAFGVLDTTMTGHSSAMDLAAMGLSISIYISVFIGLMGVIQALLPIISQHFGAKDYANIGLAWSQGVWLALGLSVIGALLMAFPELWLQFSGDIQPEVYSLIKGYLLALSFALPAGLMFRTMYVLCNAVSRPRVVMAINIAGVGFKVFFNWVFIFGHLGMPKLGAVGAGVSTAIVLWMSVGVSWIILKKDPFYAPFSIKLRAPNRRILTELLRLGLPMGAGYVIEITSFAFMAVFIAREGYIASGGHQIVANLASLCFMMPMSISVATAALAAQAIGAKNPILAFKTGSSGMKLTLIGALTTGLLLLFGRETILNLYTNDGEVAQMAMGLMNILIVFHVIDSLQCITNYLLRAHKIAMIPTLVQGVYLWGIGLFGGWYFGFYHPQAWLTSGLAKFMPGATSGAATAWVMLTFAMVMTAMTLQVYYQIIRNRHYQR